MEQTILTRLDDIGKQVTGIGKQVSDISESGRLLKMNLLGGYEAETIHGRIPKLEEQVQDIDARVAKIETAFVRYRAFAAAIGVASGFVSAIVTSAILFLIRYFMFGAHN